MAKESMPDSSSQEIQGASQSKEVLGPSVPREDVLPAFVTDKVFGEVGRIIPQEFVTSTLAGELSRQFNPLVIGSSPIHPTYEGHGYEPTTREADFMGRKDLPRPIDVVDAIGSIGANYFRSYEAIHGPDRLARMMAIIRGGQTAKLPGVQYQEDQEILQDVDRLLATLRRFAVSGRTVDASDFAKTSRDLVERYGRLNYSVQPDGSVKRTLIVPSDRRVQRFDRERLDDILPKLSFSTSRAYQYLARAHRLFGDAAVRIAIRSLPVV